eukprot:gene8518-342_t
MSTPVHVFCENIPASSSSPFEIILNQQTIFQHSESLTNPICIDVEVPDLKFGSNLLVYLGIKIPEKGIDEVKEFSLFKHGDHIHLSYSESEGLITKQRTDDNFDSKDGETRISSTKSESEVFDKSLNPKDPNLKPKVKTVVQKEPEPQGKVIFYLLNVPASYKEPTQLYVDKGLKLTLTKHQEVNKMETLEVDLLEKKKSIFVKFLVRSEGYDVQQDFDLSKGIHIQLAFEDDNLRVAQRNDKNFPTIKHQKKREDFKGDVVKATSSSSSSGSTNEVFIYGVGVKASSGKPLVVRVDGKVVHKVAKKIPDGDVVAVKIELDKPTSGDHKILVGITAPASGFFDAIEDEFNLTKHGRYLKMEITEQGNDIKCSWQQDHDDYIFKGMKPQWKPLEKQEEKKPTTTTSQPIKKETPKPTTTNTTTKPTTQTSSAPKKSTGGDSDVEQLEKLASLLERGIITQKEFDFKKKKILGL